MENWWRERANNGPTYLVQYDGGCEVLGRPCPGGPHGGRERRKGKERKGKERKGEKTLEGFWALTCARPRIALISYRFPCHVHQLKHGTAQHSTVQCSNWIRSFDAAAEGAGRCGSARGCVVCHAFSSTLHPILSYPLLAPCYTTVPVLYY